MVQILRICTSIDSAGAHEFHRSRKDLPASLFSRFRMVDRPVRLHICSDVCRGTLSSHWTRSSHAASLATTLVKLCQTSKVAGCGRVKDMRVQNRSSDRAAKNRDSVLITRRPSKTRQVFQPSAPLRDHFHTCMVRCAKRSAREAGPPRRKSERAQSRVVQHT